MFSPAHFAHKGKQPSLAQLRAFAAVAEYLHFRDAAAAIGMSQPALGRGLRPGGGARRPAPRAYDAPGAALSGGERLAVRTKAVLDAVAELMEEAEAVRAPFTGVLRLGVIPTVAPYLLPTVLRLVRDRYPDLDLQVHEEQTYSLVEGLTAGRLDVLLLAVPLGVPGVTELPVRRGLRPGHAGRAPAGRPERHPARGVARTAPAAARRGPLPARPGLDVCREAGRADGAAVTTTAAGLSTLVQLVAGGLGVTLLPRTAVRVEAERAPALATGCFADPAPSRRIALAMRAGAARAAEFEELAEALRGALASLPVRVLPAGVGQNRQTGQT